MVGKGGVLCWWCGFGTLLGPEPTDLMRSCFCFCGGGVVVLVMVVLVVLPMTGSTGALVLVWVVLVGVVVWELHSGREHLAGQT